MATNQPEQSKNEMEQVRAKADLLYTRSEVEAALDNMAAAITRQLHDKNPLFLCLMLGAVVVTGKLLSRLRFPLQLDYIHATRYRGTTSGGQLELLRMPQARIEGRNILIVDDILDEGITLKAITEACREAGASAVYTAVLVDKQLRKPKQFAKADFTGLTIPDRYVFGYGMDYKEYWRNLDGIYAVHE